MFTLLYVPARLRCPVRLLECPDRTSLLRPGGLQHATRYHAAGAGTGFRRLSGGLLAAHPGIPGIAWTVTASGGALSGQVLAPAAARRGLFGQWRQALGLDEITEIPSAGGTAVYLHARAPSAVSR